MARFLRSYPNVSAGARPAHSRLMPPVVVGKALAWYGPRILLTRIKTRRTNSELNPPTIVDIPASFVARPIKTIFANIDDKANYVVTQRGSYNLLRSPTVINSAIIFRSTQIHLSYSMRGAVKSKLRTPLVIAGAAIFNPVETKLTYSIRGKPKSKLLPPTIINAAITFAPVTTHLAPSKRGKPISRLSPPPVIINSAIVFAPINTKLALSKRGKPKSDLFAPTIVDAFVVQAFYGPKVTLSKIKPAKVNYDLTLPIVVDSAIIFRPIQVKFAPSSRGATKSKLNPPTIIDIAFVFIALPISTNYWTAVKSKQNSGLSRRLPVSTILRKPTVIGSAIILYGPGTYLVVPRSKNAQIRSYLIPPIIIDGTEAIFFGPIVKLTSSKRGKIVSRLNLPIIVASAITFRPIYQNLVSQILIKTKSQLFKPTIVGVASVEIFFGPKTKFARTPKRVARYGLAGPAVVLVIFAPVEITTRTTFAPSHRGKIKSILAAPTVISAAKIFAPVKVSLALSKRGKSQSKLFPPQIVVAVFTIRPTQIHLAYSRRAIPASKLRLPIVVDSAIIFRPIAIELTYSKRGKSRSIFITPPVITQPIVIFFGPKIKLAPSKRGKPKSFLRRPTRVLSAIVFRPISAKFASWKPIEHRTNRLPHPILRKPVIVGAARIFRSIETQLAYSKRGQPKSKLKVPIVVAAPTIFGPITTQFAPSSRLGRIQRAELRLPVVIGAAKVFAPISVTYSPSSRLARKSIYELRAPVVVTAFFARPILISLAPSSRGVIKSQLAPPTVIEIFVAESIVIRLAPSHGGAIRSVLRRPVVVDSAIIFRPIYVKLALQNLVQDRLVRAPNFRLSPPAVIFVGSQKGYHSRTKINSRESTLVIVLNRATSHVIINDRESDLDIS